MSNRKNKPTLTAHDKRVKARRSRKFARAFGDAVEFTLLAVCMAFVIGTVGYVFAAYLMPVL